MKERLHRWLLEHRTFGPLIRDWHIHDVIRLDPDFHRAAFEYREERLLGWYLESGYFAGAKAKTVRDQVNALCRELRPAARPLVDAFGISDDVLRAPDGVNG